MNLEISYNKKTGKTTKIWRLNNMPLNSQLVIEEIRGDKTKYLETNENRNMRYQNYGILHRPTSRKDKNLT